VKLDDSEAGRKKSKSLTPAALMLQQRKYIAVMDGERHAYLADFCTLQDAVGYILRLLLQRRGHHGEPKICENAPSNCGLKGPG
jgi:hypothetical protein